MERFALQQILYQTIFNSRKEINMLPTGPYNANSDPEFQRIMRRLRNARTKTKVHHETCPVCGAKLVNLYRKSPEHSEWRCRKCWEKVEAEVDSNG